MTTKTDRDDELHPAGMRPGSSNMLDVCAAAWLGGDYTRAERRAFERSLAAVLRRKAKAQEKRRAKAAS